MLEGRRGGESIAELCRREGIATNLYCTWSKEFLKVGKPRAADDMAHQASSPEVKYLRAESAALAEINPRIYRRKSKRPVDTKLRAELWGYLVR